MEKQSSSNYLQKGGGSRRSDFEVSVDIETLEEFSQLLQSQPKKLYSQSRHRRQIQKVPPQMRRRMRPSQHQVYDPLMVSIGPYHHGKPALRRAEEFKHLCLDRCAGGSQKKKAFFYSKILEEVAAIRASYAEATILDKYDDKSLALMMLLDASIIIDFIHNYLGMKGNSFSEWQKCLGAESGPLMVRDVLVMENQIPFRVLELLISLQYEKGDAASFLPRFFAGFLTYKTRINEIPQQNENENEEPPIHFLEALWRVMVKKSKQKVGDECRSRFVLSGFSMREEGVEAGISYTHRSVMDLKAKGIRVRPNPEISLGDISFRCNTCFSELELPVQYVSVLTPVVVANMIAFEVLPNSCSSLVVLSYAIFIKSLVQSPEDVKELQDRGVMLNRLVNLEKVVEMIKEIDTFGLHDQDIFKDVKTRMEEHCRSRARTWIADLIYTRFRTPWTAIAFFAALLLLCLAFLQTFFTMHPVNQRPS